MRKMQFFYENMLGNFFSIWPYAWKQNIFFCFFFLLKKKINLKVSRARTKHLIWGQNWSGPKSTETVDVNYNSRSIVQNSGTLQGEETEEEEGERERTTGRGGDVWLAWRTTWGWWRHWLRVWPPELLLLPWWQISREVVERLLMVEKMLVRLVVAAVCCWDGGEWERERQREGGRLWT